jgi:4-amino-4-deoxy-L-arabinose transferase-like glycosyltransferase
VSSITLPPAVHRRHWATRVGELVRGRASDPAWIRPSVLGLAVVTLVFYVWGLDRNGWANSYYAAAVQAGTRSWKAFFFGSLDSGNFITVDKPPASLWLMELSARIFGLSSWSMLLPEALAGVATVILVYLTVRRSFGPVAGLIAGAVMALTPVAVVMFRYNNPDALLTLLLVASAYALVRALDGGRTRWLLLSAGLVGLAFNTKDLQAYIVVPTLVVTYFVLGPGTFRRRFLQLLAAGGALIVSSGWWLAIVDLIPAASRPYIGGSIDNSVLNLVLGYNGLGRIFGQGGPAGGAVVGGGAGFGGATGLFRLFNAESGGQVTWLVPLALTGLVAGIGLHWRRLRANLAFAGYVLWGGWFATHFLVFSFAQGIYHPYYAVALAPSIAALAGAGVVDLWKLRSQSIFGALLLGAAVIGTAWWGAQLLARTPGYMPGLGTLELALAAIAAAAIVVTRVPGLRRLVPSRISVALTAVGLAALMLGPSAYDYTTVAQSNTGAIASAGPAAAIGPNGRIFSGAPGPTGTLPISIPAGARFSFGRAGMGEALSSDVIAYLEKNQGRATWLLAVQSANSAATIELATGRPVLAMGGFSGSDPAPTAQQIAQLVSSGQLRFVMLGGAMSGRGGPAGPTSTGAVQQAIQWVQANCVSVTVGTTTLYDCAA